MISTSNYVARKYGVRSAMPGFIGKKLCPELVFVKCHYEKYTLVSEQIKGIIREYDPNFTSHSLDEVYMDLTNAAYERIKNTHITGILSPSSSSSAGCAVDSTLESEPTSCSSSSSIPESRSKSGSSSSSGSGCDPLVGTMKEFENDGKGSITVIQLREAACAVLQEIRERVRTETGGLTCSAGIANNFQLAKICADVNKPNGQYALPPTREGVCGVVSVVCVGDGLIGVWVVFDVCV
jgi:DNA polymerase kappa